MYRFYCPDADFSKSSFAITDKHEIHHIKDVLRLKKGDSIQIFNAHSKQAQVILEEIKGSAIHVKVGKIQEGQEQGAKIILACAPPKKGKFEFIIEKATELGVDEIIPLKTKRAEVVFDKDRIKGKLSRFEAVAINAAKQSKRIKVPLIHPMMSFHEVFKILDPKALKIIPSLNGQPTHIFEVLNKYVVSHAGHPQLFVIPECFCRAIIPDTRRSSESRTCHFWTPDPRQKHSGAGCNIRG